MSGLRTRYGVSQQASSKRNPTLQSERSLLARSYQIESGV